MWARYLSRYSDWLRAGRSGDRIPVEARFSAPVQAGPGAHPASCTMGTVSFPGVESGRGVTLTPHPLLVLRSTKQSRAIPLLSLRAFDVYKKGWNLPTYLPTHPPTYLLTYLPTYLLPTYSPTYLLTYLPTYLHIYLPTHPHTYSPTYILTYLPTYLPTYSPTYPPTYLPKCSDSSFGSTFHHKYQQFSWQNKPDNDVTIYTVITWWSGTSLPITSFDVLLTAKSKGSKHLNSWICKSRLLVAQLQSDVVQLLTMFMDVKCELKL
jgi:hypothetical protein